MTLAALPTLSSAGFLEGPFTTQTALARGWSRRQLDHEVAEGRLHRLFHSVYVADQVEDSFTMRVSAVRLILPKHAVVVDRTAAWLWGVDTWTSHDREGLRLEVFVLRGYKRMTRAEAGGGERDLLPEDIVVREGVPITTPVRTCLDLACGLRPYDAIAALDAIGRAQGVTAFDMMALLPRFRGRRGVVQARSLVQLVDPRAESPGESITRLAIDEAGLPTPTPQHWVNVDGRMSYRLDLAYVRQKIAVEYDGEEYHSSPERRAADAERRACLRRQGWIVIVVTKDSFTPDALRAWLSELSAALETRRSWR